MTKNFITNSMQQFLIILYSLLLLFLSPKRFSQFFCFLLQALNISTYLIFMLNALFKLN